MSFSLIPLEFFELQELFVILVVVGLPSLCVLVAAGAAVVAVTALVPVVLVAAGVLGVVASLVSVLVVLAVRGLTSLVRTAPAAFVVAGVTWGPIVWSLSSGWGIGLADRYWIPDVDEIGNVQGICAQFGFLFIQDSL